MNAKKKQNVEWKRVIATPETQDMHARRNRNKNRREDSNFQDICRQLFESDQAHDLNTHFHRQASKFNNKKGLVFKMKGAHNA
jgi:hypothetical protein